MDSKRARHKNRARFLLDRPLFLITRSALNRQKETRKMLNLAGLIPFKTFEPTHTGADQKGLLN
jgi:hypothetical protein